MVFRPILHIQERSAETVIPAERFLNIAKRRPTFSLVFSNLL